MRNIPLRSDLPFLRLTLCLLLTGTFLIASCKNATTSEEFPEKGNSGRIISFSGYDWLVKSSSTTLSGTAAPGNNVYSDSTENVWIDKTGWLHLKITNRNNNWYCAEVTLTKPLGYKKYIFQVSGLIGQFHPNVVGGLFTYLDSTDNAEEIDIEFSKWGESNNSKMLNYAIQPSDISDNTQNFGIDLNVNESTHLFDWKPGEVAFASYSGYYTSAPADNMMVISEWNYSAKDVPIDLNGKIHINLWLFQREKIDPNDHPEAELVIKSFQAL